ncbi:MAG: Flagellar hook-associated protein 2 [Pseudomonadota bacterium]|nr:Flagellar hook-associated protein 2 [Pseudomonadota bacterium]
MINAITNYYNNPYILGLQQQIYGTGSNSGLFGINPANTQLSGATGLSQLESSTKVKLSSLGRLRSGLDALGDNIGALGNKSTVAPFVAASSNQAVARSEAASNVKRAGQYQLSVSQLARGQELSSNPLSDKDSTIVGSGSLKFEFGRTSASSFTAERSASVSISSTDGTLGGIANAINRANIGVTASVSESDEGYRLNLRSQDGSNNTLRISVSDNDGNNLDLAGLSKLAYNPVGGDSGDGRNLTQSVAASDASFTIDGRNQAGNANTNNAAINGVKLTLTGVGDASIEITRDAKAFQTSAGKLVEQLNIYQKSTDGLTDKGIGAKINNQLQAVINDSSSGYGNDRLTLKSLGIQADSKGTFSVDSGKLQASFAANPEGAVDLLSKVASGIKQIADSNTGSTAELQINSRQLERSLELIDTQRSLLYNYNQQYVNGLPADSITSLFNYVPKFNGNSPIARYLAVAGL